ncbi:proline-rich receptor-like protein kinase PERK14 [Drosophila yakuba]|uniref:proline-rich receptor-like protein kinase PERK14 n=1 Tax=Drosophila yakuba TaxID=7245 RepID=UPI001C8932D6|nr:proline-rich receptor-like protein kinase PERK14 [Drosophila yakuba]
MASQRVHVFAYPFVGPFRCSVCMDASGMHPTRSLGEYGTYAAAYQHITRRHPQVVITYRCRVCGADMPRGMKQLKAHVAASHPETTTDAHGMLVEAATAPNPALPLPAFSPRQSALSPVTTRASERGTPLPTSRRVLCTTPSRAMLPGNMPHPALSPVVTGASGRTGRTVAPIPPTRQMAPRAPTAAQTPSPAPQRPPARNVPPAPLGQVTGVTRRLLRSGNQPPISSIPPRSPSSSVPARSPISSAPARSPTTTRTTTPSRTGLGVSAPSAPSRRTPERPTSTATAGRPGTKPTRTYPEPPPAEGPQSA